MSTRNSKVEVSPDYIFGRKSQELLFFEEDRRHTILKNGEIAERVKFNPLPDCSTFQLISTHSRRKFKQISDGKLTKIPLLIYIKAN
jgi:hypothetical protein